MLTTHHKGLIGEFEFISHLLKKGITVLTPINPNSSYDLVIEKEGQFQRIQVKYCSPKGGVLIVHLDRPMRKTKSYRDRNVDLIGVYDSQNDKFYLIPINEIKSRRKFHLRVEKTKSAQQKLINLASDYLV